MTLQEEIREEIGGKIVFEFRLISPMPLEELHYNAGKLTDEILKFLDSKGVVAKGVEATTDRPGYRHYIKRLIDA